MKTHEANLKTALQFFAAEIVRVDRLSQATRAWLATAGKCDGLCSFPCKCVCKP